MAATATFFATAYLAANTTYGDTMTRAVSPSSLLLGWKRLDNLFLQAISCLAVIAFYILVSSLDASLEIDELVVRTRFPLSTYQRNIPIDFVL